MKLSEANARIDELRTRRDELHEMLHQLIADKSITVGDREGRESVLRSEILSINQECYPLEVVRGKTGKLLKGESLTQEEQALYERCLETTGELGLG
tara:strand:+ start:8596 stop:8886 length:291 start_codon:yes stop_codon:yes gene_type:complete